MTIENRVKVDDCKVGETYDLHWSPYSWAVKEFNLDTPMTVEVKENSTFDLRMETKDGFPLKYCKDNGYVTSGRGGTPYDKGRFRFLTECDG